MIDHVNDRSLCVMIYHYTWFDHGTSDRSLGMIDHVLPWSLTPNEWSRMPWLITPNDRSSRIMIDHYAWSITPNDRSSRIMIDHYAWSISRRDRGTFSIIRRDRGQFSITSCDRDRMIGKWLLTACDRDRMSQSISGPVIVIERTTHFEIGDRAQHCIYIYMRK